MNASFQQQNEDQPLLRTGEKLFSNKAKAPISHDDARTRSPSRDEIPSTRQRNPQEEFEPQHLSGGKQRSEEILFVLSSDAQPQPQSGKEVPSQAKYGTIQQHDTAQTHTYAFCSHCDTLLNCDIWGCGCCGPDRTRDSIGGGVHGIERIIFTPGRCNHCAKRGQRIETQCEPARCVKCINMA